MTEEQPNRPGKSAEDMKALEQKRELRGLREQLRTLREKGKEIATEKERVNARYAALSEEMGLPPLKSRSKAPATSDHSME